MSLLWAVVPAGAVHRLDYPEMFSLYPTVAQARAAAGNSGLPAVVLKPLAGNPQARLLTGEGGSFVRLQCRFQSADLSRAGWDIPLRVDLRGVAGIRFRLRAENLAPVSYFTFYFQSGDGWYVAEFSPRDDGLWQSIEILKSQTTIEGEPAGWREISGLRISAWRGHREDTYFDLAGFGRLPADRRLVMVRGSHGLSGLPAGEKSSVLTYSRRAAELLGEYGVVPAWIEETDLDLEFLDPGRVVVLPYSPQLPAAAARVLAEFVSIRNGRIIGFHTHAQELAPATGLLQTGRIGSDEVQADGLARISVDPRELAGGPAEVRQNSWNISLFRGLHKEPRVLARWLDRSRRDTGHPALLQTDTALWLSHVLINSEIESGGRLLLAMIGHFMPELWRETANNRLQRLGRQLPYRDFNDGYRKLLAKSAGREQAVSWLEVAVNRRRAAFQAFANGDYPLVLERMAEAENGLTEAFLRVQTAAGPDEFRAAWCHRGEGVGDWGWEPTIREFRRHGFNAMIANMAHPAMAWYPSRYLPGAQTVTSQCDPLADLTEACRRHGVDAHIWLMLFRLGYPRDETMVSRLRRENRLLMNRDGSFDEDWICPADPRNRRLILNVIREIVENYEVAGIHLDYVRYPSPNSGFGPAARQGFEREVGRALTPWPGILEQDLELAARWHRFRVEQINSLVRDAGRVIRQARPEVKLSAAVFRNEASAITSIAQDWRQWARQGWLDFVTPMNYTESLDGFIHATRRQLEAAKSFEIAVYPGLGLTTDRLGSIGTARQIKAARRLGAQGFVLFEINQETALTVFPDLAKGVTGE